MSTLEEDAILPLLRPELQLLPGIREVSGIQSWLIFDPIRHLYFQIDARNHAMLSNWSGGTAGDLVSKRLYGGIDLQAIEQLLRFLWVNSLTCSPPGGDVDFYSRQKEGAKKHWLPKILHSYLFFVVPLFRPDNFLNKTKHITRLFFMRRWIVVMVLLALVGLYLVSRQWDQFVHTFVNYFSLQGLVYYAVALIFVKIAHEFAHAYAAARYGCKVKSMGIALIVMFPVLYTDTTDSWKLTDKRKRLIITGAGVIVELYISTLATLLWCFSDDGPLRSAAFFVATTSWVMSVAINMNPLMRFDAYYFLSDLLGLQNLQGRSFAIGRWRLREFLFNIGEAKPEALPVRWVRGLTLFAWATWIYRFFLFLGIAIIVHRMFYPPFGAILAIVEVMFFIVIPIMKEMNQWYERSEAIVARRTSWISGAVFLAFLAMIMFPWQTTLRLPAVLESQRLAEIYVPTNAEVIALHVEQGDRVNQGQLLVELASDELEYKTVVIQREIALRTTLLNRIAADPLDLEGRVVIESELRRYGEELAGIDKERAQLTIIAPFDGVIGNLSSALHGGRWVSSERRLLTVHDNTAVVARGFASRGQLERVSSTSSAIFIPDLPELGKFTGKVALVEAANVNEINIPVLSTVYGGPIAVAEYEGRLEPLKTWYKVKIEIDDSDHRLAQQRPGLLHVEGEPESIALGLWRRVFQVLLREIYI